MTTTLSAFSTKTNKLPLSSINGGYLYFSYTDVLRHLYKEVIRLCNQCSDMVLPDDVRQHVVLLDSYNSATIEGARTTIGDVTQSLSRPKCDRSTSERMVTNNVEALNFLCREHFNLQNFVAAWKLIVDGVCENTSKGTDGFRTGMVNIGNDFRIVHVPEVPEKIESRMIELFKYVSESTDHPIIKSIVFHFYSVYIHPFCDGNGRISRAASVVLLTKNGYKFFSNVPISKAINESLSRYYYCIQRSERLHGQNIDITDFIMYMLNIYVSALKQYLLLKEPLDEQESVVLSKMVHPNRGEISIVKCADMLKCSEQEALQVINSMCDKGYLSFVDGEYRIGWRTGRHM